MAPLIEAINANYISRNGKIAKYSGNVDGDWTIGMVPNGGYALALIIDACLQEQAQTAHKDVLHVTAHFLQATAVAPYEVQIKTVKQGKAFSNISAELVQSNRVRIIIHCIFGTNATAEAEPRLELAAPSPYARRLPLSHHPSAVTPSALPPRGAYKFGPRVMFAYDKVLEENNLPDHPKRTNSGTVGGGGLDWGSWVTLRGPEEKITSPSLAFFGDICLNLPALLPRAEKSDVISKSWFPTMTLSIEFRYPLPIPESGKYADRTVGVYSTGYFMHNPSGRHDVYTEVWSAPSNIGEGREVKGWRDDQRCLATLTQMALVVPMEINLAKAKASL